MRGDGSEGRRDSPLILLLDTGAGRDDLGRPTVRAAFDGYQKPSTWLAETRL